MGRKKKKTINLTKLEPEEKLKYEIAEELGLLDRVMQDGWKSLTSKETGRIGGMVTGRRREIKKQTKIADENDIPFIDMNLKSVRKELDFNYKTDLADAIHLNIKGAKKTSEFLGKYLTENYYLTDYIEGNNIGKKSVEKYKKYD